MRMETGQLWCDAETGEQFVVLAATFEGVIIRSLDDDSVITAAFEAFEDGDYERLDDEE